MDKLLESLDMLDLVLAVFGALMFALWRGRGKNLQSLLMGAAMGGFVKPTLFMALGFGAMVLVNMPSGDDPSQPQNKSIKDQDALLKYWTK